MNNILGWLIENDHPEKNAKCKVCKKELRAHKTDLIKHKNTVLHIKNMRSLDLLGTRQSTLNSHIIQISNNEKERDIRLAVFTAMHTSIRSIDHLGLLIKKMGPGLETLRLHRTKCSGLIKNVIAPALLHDLINKLKNVRFSVLIDESTDCTINNYMCICVKYFDNDQEKVVTNFLALVQLEDASADALFSKFTNMLDEFGLPLANLIGIGTDGANNLCGKNHSLYTLLKDKCANIQLVRCICHSLNNAVSKAAEEMPAAVDFMCREVYNWFSNSPKRKLQYQLLFEKLNNRNKKFHNFVQLSSTRWLCRFHAIDRIIEHWEELKTHFKNVVQNEKCYSARVLNQMLNDNSNLLFLKIVHPVVYEINKVNLIFQANDTQLNSYQEVTRLIILVAKKVMKPIFANTDDLSIITDNIHNPLAYVDASETDFGVQYFTSLNQYKVTSSEKTDIDNKCNAYLKRLLKELVIRLPDNLKHIKKVEVFNPKMCLSPIGRAKFSNLPFLELAPLDKLFQIENEYNSLTFVNWVQTYGEDVLNNSYVFWPTVYKNHKGFENLALFVLTILSFPNSNAVVERVFSIMNCVKTKTRNKMKLDMLSAILRIKTTVYSTQLCCAKFPVSKEMVKRFVADSVYKTDNSETDDNIFDIICEVENDQNDVLTDCH